MGYLLRCTLCREKFKWDVSGGYPDKCPCCGEKIGHDRADSDIVMPSLRSMKTTATDNVYREVERTSEVRMEQAAEMAGCSPSDMSSLKITNLRDNNRQGDVAAIPVNNEVTRQMEAINARGGQFGFGRDAGLGYSASVSQGPVPNAGVRALMGTRNDHMRHEGGNAVSDLPPIEMQNPNYRPRV